MTQSVLIVGNFLSSSGGSRGVCEELAERLAARDWRVLTTSRKRPKLLRLADMVLSAVKHRHAYGVAQVDVFSGPAFLFAEAVGCTLRRLNKPYVLTLHGGNLPEFAKRWPGRVRQLLTSARAVTAPSEYLKQKMEPYCNQIRILPNALDMSAYLYRERGPARPRLVWLRSFHEIYNPVMAVKAMVALSQKYPDVELNMVGPDKGDGSFARTRAQVTRGELTNQVRFAGQVAKKEVPKVLSDGDIFLNTTNIDNTPVSVIEAMACGLCVVSTRVGGTPFLIDHEQNGLLVECGDSEGMAASAGRFLENEALARRCSQAGRHKVEAWDWPTVLAEWDNLLRSAMTEESQRYSGSSIGDDSAENKFRPPQPYPRGEKAEARADLFHP